MLLILVSDFSLKIGKRGISAWSALLKAKTIGEIQNNLILQPLAN